MSRENADSMLSRVLDVADKEVSKQDYSAALQSELSEGGFGMGSESFGAKCIGRIHALGPFKREAARGHSRTCCLPAPGVGLETLIY